MNGNRFDTVSRRMAERYPRRSVVRGLVGGGGLLLVLRARNAIAGNPEKVSMCHKPGTPAEKTLVVAASAVKVHLGHGDAPGQCHACSIEGEMVCQGSGFTVCENGEWVDRDCAPGTACRPSTTSGIICDWPT